jgi:hypothetical protein
MPPLAIGRRRHDRLGLALATLLVGAVPAVGQELDPGAYTVAPINLNVFVAATTLSRGDIAFDPA